jgi:hypothetical protein
MATGQQFNLRWNNHTNNILQVFCLGVILNELLNTKQLVFFKNQFFFCTKFGYYTPCYEAHCWSLNPGLSEPHCPWGLYLLLLLVDNLLASMAHVLSISDSAFQGVKYFYFRHSHSLLFCPAIEIIIFSQLKPIIQ